MQTRHDETVVMVLWAAALALSAVAPRDLATWFLEVAPVLIAAPLIWATRRRFPLSRILLWCACGHGLILIMGGHYTYAHVPLGFWLQDVFGFARNPYDRIGHLAQGFVPALLTREILLRKTALLPGKMLFVLACSVPLAFSAFYEMIEWWAAAIMDQDAEAFLGTQGDVWDTQWDMFMALVGAAAAQVLLARVQDRQLDRIGGTP
jgi:putative membrane protein